MSTVLVVLQSYPFVMEDGRHVAPGEIVEKPKGDYAEAVTNGQVALVERTEPTRRSKNDTRAETPENPAPENI